MSNKDQRVTLSLTGDPRIIHARIREQTEKEATIYIRLRMFTTGKECHLKNAKNVIREVTFKEAFSVSTDDTAMIHLELAFKNAAANDPPETTDTAVWLVTPEYGEPIECKLYESTPQLMLVKTELLAFIRKGTRGLLDAEGLLSNQQDGTRQVRVEGMKITKDPNDIPELEVKIHYLDEPRPTATLKPNQTTGQQPRDTPIPGSDPLKPTVILTVAPPSAAPKATHDTNSLRAMEQSLGGGKKDQESGWQAVSGWAAKYGKITVGLLMTIALGLIGVFVMDAIRVSRRRAADSAPVNSVASVIQPTASAVTSIETVDVVPTYPITPITAAPVESAATATTSAAPTDSANIETMPTAAPAVPTNVALVVEPSCVNMTQNNLRLFFMQSDPSCMSGKILGLNETDTLHIRCSGEPSYDKSRKCSDVRNCKICLPRAEDATPGAREFTDALAQAYYHQASARCFIEPSLPFNVNPNNLREGLRIDTECQDFSFNPVRGCFDYSNCKLIVPAYER